MAGRGKPPLELTLKIAIRPVLVALALCASFAGRADVVGHWRFDEAAGMVAADSSPSGILGSLSGTASFAPGGIAGNCLALTSAGNGMVRFGNVLPMTGQSFSISAWIKTASTNVQYVVCKQGNAQQVGYVLAFNQGGPYGAPNKGWFYQSNAGGSEPRSSSDVNTATWKHLVGVYELGVAARIYVDGVLEDTKPPIAIAGNSFDLSIGGVVISAPNYSGIYDGLVDDVQMYDRALSDSEVAYLFSNPGKESWQVRGQIKQAGVGVGGVTVNVKQGATIMATGTTDASGNYSVGGLEVGTYTIEPASDSKYFFPSTKQVTLSPDAASQNFTAANVGPFSITFEHPVVYSDQSRRGILGLNVPTPVDRPVSMSDNSFKLTSPILVTVPAGLRTKDFFVYGVSVTADVLVTVTATCQGVTATGQITVRQKPALTGITLADTVKGGRGVSGSVSIDKPAIAAMALQITSSDLALATVSPSNTAMPNGAVTKAFYCKTFPVVSNQMVTITAKFYGSTATKLVTITP